jgi:uncharacterized protein (TIGR02996 family)
VAKKRPPRRRRTAQDAAFMRAILEAPQDDAPRLVYADWLTDHGDEADRDRAEFIRVQVELARGVGGAKRKRLEARDAELLNQYGDEWRKQLPDFMRHRSTRFERGFAGRVRCWLENFATQADVIWQAAPVTALDLFDPRGMSGDVDFSARQHAQNLNNYLKAAAAVPHLRHLHTLSICETGISGRHVTTILASPYLSGLRSLDLSSNGYGDSLAEAVVASPRSESLTTLDLCENNLGDRGAVALANAPRLAKLTTLLLSSNRIGEQGGLALAASPHLASLQRLHLEGEDVGASARDALRVRFGLRVTL